MLKVDIGAGNGVVQMALAIEANMRSREGRLQEALDLLFRSMKVNCHKETLIKLLI
jgi:tRNA1(Val) A37 N6-methylase TrmN6